MQQDTQEECPCLRCQTLYGLQGGLKVWDRNCHTRTCTGSVLRALQLSLSFHWNSSFALDHRPAWASQGPSTPVSTFILLVSTITPPPHTVHVLEGTLPPYTPGLVSWVNLGFLLLLWDNSCPPFELSSFGHPLPERQTSMRGPWSGCCPITALIQLPWHSASPN